MSLDAPCEEGNVDHLPCSRVLGVLQEEHQEGSRQEQVGHYESYADRDLDLLGRERDDGQRRHQGPVRAGRKFTLYPVNCLFTQHLP